MYASAGFYGELHAAPVTYRYTEPVTTLLCDSQHELLWAGGQSGHMYTMHAPSLEPYAHWNCHSSTVLQTLPVGDFCLSLSAEKGVLSARGGLTRTTMTVEAGDATCLCLEPGSSNSRALIGHASGALTSFDLATGKTSTVCAAGSQAPGALALRAPVGRGAVALGSASGKIHILDPRAKCKADAGHVAHTGGLIAMDARGDTVACCGYNVRMGALVPEAVVKVFDVRGALRPVFTLPTVTPPSVLVFHPTLSSTLMVASADGAITMADVAAATCLPLCQLDTLEGDALLTAQISSSGELLAFGASGGYIHLWSDTMTPRVNLTSVPLVQPPLRPTPSVLISEEDPCSAVPLHQPPTGRLLSDVSLYEPVAIGLAPRLIEPALRKDLKQVDFVGYIPNPYYVRGKPYGVAARACAALRNQRLSMLSERPDPAAAKAERAKQRAAAGGAVLPMRYHAVGIKVQSSVKFEEFDFSYYNRTRFGGLENDIPNCYCNSLLQALYFVPSFRAAILAHKPEPELEFCLTCELSFLFRMLLTAHGTPCQATNLLRALRQIREAGALGLLDTPSSTCTSTDNANNANPTAKAYGLSKKLAALSRFLTEQCHKEATTCQATSTHSKALSTASPTPPSPFTTPGKPPLASVSTSKIAHAGQASNAAAPASTPSALVGQTPAGQTSASEGLAPQLEAMFGLTYRQHTKCLTGAAAERTQERRTFQVDLKYPVSQERATKQAQEAKDLGLSRLPGATAVGGTAVLGADATFAQLLEQSLTATSDMRAWFDEARGYQLVRQSRVPLKMPQVLAVNCAVTATLDVAWWCTESAATAPAVATATATTPSAPTTPRAAESPTAGSGSSQLQATAPPFKLAGSTAAGGSAPTSPVPKAAAAGVSSPSTKPAMSSSLSAASPAKSMTATSSSPRSAALSAAAIAAGALPLSGMPTEASAAAAVASAAVEPRPEPNKLPWALAVRCDPVSQRVEVTQGSSAVELSMAAGIADAATGCVSYYELSTVVCQIRDADEAREAGSHTYEGHLVSLIQVSSSYSEEPDIPLPLTQPPLGAGTSPHLLRKSSSLGHYQVHHAGTGHSGSQTPGQPPLTRGHRTSSNNPLVSAGGTMGSGALAAASGGHGFDLPDDLDDVFASVDFRPGGFGGVAEDEEDVADIEQSDITTRRRSFDESSGADRRRSIDDRGDSRAVADHSSGIPIPSRPSGGSGNGQAPVVGSFGSFNRRRGSGMGQRTLSKALPVVPTGSSSAEWLLFNDFSISQVPSAEVLHTYGGQKLPCLLYYRRVDLAPPASTTPAASGTDNLTASSTSSAVIPPTPFAAIASSTTTSPSTTAVTAPSGRTPRTSSGGNLAASSSTSTSPAPQTPTAPAGAVTGGIASAPGSAPGSAAGTSARASAAPVCCPVLTLAEFGALAVAPPLQGASAKLPPFRHRPLDLPKEAPTPGTLMAIDAEFVALSPSEKTFDSSTEIQTKSARLSLARVSVVRGDGPRAGTPCIDDYVRAVEPVYDHLTRYSGLVPGDLDPQVSRHYLTTLRHSYLKLRFLLDAGCVFIGHGLKKDFRMINMVCPPEQIIDTVELFSFKRQRKLSLRFLASYLLGTTIQSTTHDAIEDARTALRLYQKYQELVANGSFQSKLSELYAWGKKYGYEPVTLKGGIPQPPMTM